MTKKQIGALMRKEREARGWTWNRTATESGLKADQIKGIEQASKAYTNDSLLVLAKVFGYRQEFVKAKGSEVAFTKGSDDSKDVRG
jgi:transcriptional regulator with XRE-family HTH domain